MLHEDNKTGGIGAEIAALLAEECFDCLDGPILRIAAPDTPVPFSTPLEEFFLPKASDVVAAARSWQRINPEEHADRYHHAATRRKHR